MSRRTVTNVKLPDALTRWYFENFEDPMSSTLTELLQLFKEFSEYHELYAADEVISRMRELYEDS